MTRICVVCAKTPIIRCTRRGPYRLESAYLCRTCAPAWVAGKPSTREGLARLVVSVLLVAIALACGAGQ